MQKVNGLKKRLQKAARIVPLLLLLLLLGVWLSDHGMGIPCVFYSLTGLQCPGCGVTRMTSALLKGDFSAAYQSNAAVFLLLPVFFFLGGYTVLHWLRTGSWALPRWADVLVAVCAVILVLFCVFRNAAALGWL